MYSARASYVTAAVETAAPAKLVTMLFDRLLLDVDRASAAFERGETLEGRTLVQHAQDIVAELMASLDVAAWEGGPALMSVYAFLYSSLVDAALTSDVATLASCRELIASLTATWHEAAELAVAGTAPAAAATPAGAGLLGIG
ncbi:MAG: flagellar export chaperone FliS [Cellulomonas sp.]|uniref:Flagellar protein FliS n=1 Tax=Cellulomonas gelida TaxID=1712 RepID=A0A4Y3KQR9_9CELL|nr:MULTISPECIES: flagellar export chaperone FliS [Cellulomonas]KMM46908.1 flagellar biosynthesis protein FliS [Cellulomonas sp. A375-1]MCR6649598.1 flagellar export chaperone FliS [Cellulomonas sp.]MCR6705569.1 flagellar export chaperone FliS [Cellulomonas sp.]GEA85300.1 flagellar protein FliS [Cellulomonas gelida]GGL16947.1 flagellar protein FliS [Cellulomonas gelida]